MAKRKPTPPPSPFPPEIDRRHFASWLSGFADGEGCFYLGQYTKPTKSGRPCTYPMIHFEITLRKDDLEVLQLIQSFFGCGTIRTEGWGKKSMPKAKPRAIFRVAKVKDQVDRIIPHFDAYRLLAKKKHDYLIWKEGVLLQHKIVSRGRKSRGRGTGSLPLWTPEEHVTFLELVTKLRTQREYKTLTSS